MYLTKSRLGFSHLRYHKFKHEFLEANDPNCNCGTVIEKTVHYFLDCSNFSIARNTLLIDFASIYRSFDDQDKNKIIQSFLCGHLTYSFNNNK